MNVLNDVKVYVEVVEVLRRVKHQKDFLFCLYSVWFLVFAIFFLLHLLAYINPTFFNDIHQYFIFNTSNLNTNVFFSSYTHIIPNHLIVNILSYSILLWLIFSLVDNKNKLKSLMFMSLIVFPFVNSLLLTFIPDISNGNGLSGILTCLYGYLFFAGYYNLKNSLQLSVKMYSVFMLIFVDIFAAIYFTSNNYYALLFAIVIFMLLIYQNKENIIYMWEYFKNLKGNDIEQSRFLIIWLLILYFSLIVITLLSPVFSTNSNVGYEAHRIGWVYGLIVSLVIMHNK